MQTEPALHPTAIVDPTATIHPNAHVGAFAFIGANTTLASGTVVEPHGMVGRNTTLGTNNIVKSYALVGGDPQIYGYDGEDVFLHVGNGNVFYPHTNISRGSIAGGGTTTVGNNNYFLHCSHIGHDVIIGNNVTLGGYSGVSGHAHIDDGATLGGHVGIHQFLRVGKLAMVSYTRITKDVAPYTTATPHKGYSTALNTVGLRRNGMDRKTIAALKVALRIYTDKNLTLAEVRQQIADLDQIPEIQEFLNFINQDSKRSYGR